MCAVPSQVRGRRAGPYDVGKSGCFAKVMQLSAARGSHSAWGWCQHQPHLSRAFTSRSDVPPHQPLDLAEALAKLATVLKEPLSSQSLEKEFGVNIGRVTTETKYTEVLCGGGSGGRGLSRLGSHAPIQRILHANHEHPEVIIAVHGTERGDLKNFLGNPGAGSATQRSILFTTVVISETCDESSYWSGDLDEGRIGGFERQHAVLCQIYGMLQSAVKASCSDCPTPTPDQMSTGRPPNYQQSSHGTGKRRRSRRRKSNTWS